MRFGLFPCLILISPPVSSTLESRTSSSFTSVPHLECVLHAMINYFMFGGLRPNSLQVWGLRQKSTSLHLTAA
ncbi:hypothetical protein BGW80DRAFT_1364372 [Lactifluus volemus]|nr:hypothetical protein BGW80DRAFT_1409801 [Lactifluus volemus]KAH9960358.1 hypothetical protein BGW80DRAFT_1364372 [Lactifluus volemus]